MADELADLLLDCRVMGRLDAGWHRMRQADLFLELALAQVLYNEGILLQLCRLGSLLPRHLQQQIDKTYSPNAPSHELECMSTNVIDSTIMTTMVTGSLLNCSGNLLMVTVVCSNT